MMINCLQMQQHAAQHMMSQMPQQQQMIPQGMAQQQQQMIPQGMAQQQQQIQQPQQQGMQAGHQMYQVISHCTVFYSFFYFRSIFTACFELISLISVIFRFELAIIK